MEKKVLLGVIDHLYEFDAQHQGESAYTLADFAGYLNAQIDSKPSDMREAGGGMHDDLESARRDNNSDVSILITLMFRYAKNYIKKALQDSVIQTADEFAFLVTVMSHGSLTKTELINKQIMEKTSGVEVIKRLLNHKLIRESADESDKRSVRVAITPKGIKEVQKVLPGMGQVSKLVVGNLTPPEINTLTYLLKKLDYFHHNIFINKRTLSINEILEQAEPDR